MADALKGIAILALLSSSAICFLIARDQAWKYFKRRWFFGDADAE